MSKSPEKTYETHKTLAASTRNQVGCVSLRDNPSREAVLATDLTTTARKLQTTILKSMQNINSVAIHNL